MPDPTPQEPPKETPVKKEAKKSFLASLFKKKPRAALPEGARPIDLPSPSEKKDVPAPSLSLIDEKKSPLKTPEVSSKTEKSSPPSQPDAAKSAEPPSKFEGTKLFRSLDLFKKDREEKMSTLGHPPKLDVAKPKSDAKPVSKIAEPKKEEAPKTETKADAPKPKEEKKPEPKPSLFSKFSKSTESTPISIKKADPSVPSSIFVRSTPPSQPKEEEKTKAKEDVSAASAKPSISSLPPAYPDKGKEEGTKKEEQKPVAETKIPERKDAAPEGDLRATIQKVEAGKPRQRKGGRAIVDMPPSEKREERSYGLFSKRILLILAALILSFGVFSLYYFLRETRLQVNIQTEGVELSPQVYVVYDFSDRAEMIKRNLLARRSPVRELLDDAVASLNASQADYSGKMQRKKLLQENIEKDQAEIPAMLTRTRNELDTLWDKESKKLDQDYKSAKDDFNKTIEDKAKSLGLKYNPNPDLDEPEVAVNAFRLSLYGAPKGVNVTEQRKWAEDFLQEWRKKEVDWSERRLKIRKEAEGLRAPVGGMINEIKKRAEFLQSQIAEVDEELALIQNEVNRFEDRVAAYQKEMEDLIRPFYEELVRIPDDYKKLSYSISSPGRVDVREIEKSKDLPPGVYRLLVRGVKDGQEYWALVNFELKQFKNNVVEVKPSDFKPARKFIE